MSSMLCQKNSTGAADQNQLTGTLPALALPSGFKVRCAGCVLDA